MGDIQFYPQNRREGIARTFRGKSGHVRPGNGVSGPPIAPGAEFVYEFRATPADTHWYHSHTGVQYGDGLFGPLLVDERTPIATYDRDEVLLLNDWFLEPDDTLLARLLKGGMGKMPGKPGPASPE